MFNMAKPEPSLEDLQNEWKQMFQKTLPSAALSKSDAQPKWPVHVDHCFARIILDHVVGIDSHWTGNIKSPAYRNMSREQLQSSISLGQKILSGRVNLVSLDNKSRELRSKNSKVKSPSTGQTEAKAYAHIIKSNSTKREREREPDDDTEIPQTHAKKRRTSTSPPPLHQQAQSTDDAAPISAESTAEDSTSNKGGKEDLTHYIKKIALSHKTDFQKKVLTALCQIPRGKYTTYAAISKWLDSSPRAVGNAVRNNPFAPQVPCHRVLASGGGIGGFHGSWGRGGEAGLNDDKKRKLLRDEGVRFDGKGKVVGVVWGGFK